MHAVAKHKSERTTQQATFCNCRACHAEIAMTLKLIN